MLLPTAAKDWHLDIDSYINPYVPRNLIYRLPTPISHFLGHRDRPRQPVGNLLVAAWSFLGAFVGIAVIEAVFRIPALHEHGTPLLIASFGAAAILEFNTIESPLAQPRNTIIGHFLSALIGVGITKLFSLSQNFEGLRWIAGALACGLASAIMTVTKTIYPPAGATALLAAVDPQVEHLGWFLLPLIILSAALTLVVSLLLNNIQRQYPTYWWTPTDIGIEKKARDTEKVPESSRSSSLAKAIAHTKSSEGNSIQITPDHIYVPKDIFLAGEERGIMEALQGRLRNEHAQEPETAVQPVDPA